MDRRKLTQPFCFECGKDSFETEAAAQTRRANYAAGAAKGNRSRKPPAGVYPCPSGHGFHLTSNVKLGTRRYRKGKR